MRPTRQSLVGAAARAAATREPTFGVGGDQGASHSRRPLRSCQSGGNLATYAGLRSTEAHPTHTPCGCRFRCLHERRVQSKLRPPGSASSQSLNREGDIDTLTPEPERTRTIRAFVPRRIRVQILLGSAHRNQCDGRFGNILARRLNNPRRQSCLRTA